MSIVLTTSPAAAAGGPNSPIAAAVAAAAAPGTIVKVSPVTAAQAAAAAAAGGVYRTAHRQHFAPVTLDFSEQMGLAVRVAAAAGTPNSSPIGAAVTAKRFQAVALKQNHAATVVMSAPTTPIKTSPPVISPIKAGGQSVLNKRPSPVFTIASPKTPSSTRHHPHHRHSPVKPAAATKSASLPAATASSQQPVALTSAIDSPSRLRELLMAQLDLIQRQSEAIVSKDRQLQQLRRDNRQLQQRLKEFNEEVRVEVTPPPKRTVADKSVGPDTPAPPPRSRKQRKRTHSEATAATSTDEDDEDDEDETCPLVETAETYFTFQGEAFCASEARHIKTILSQSEVPRWREVLVTPDQPRGRAEAGAAAAEDMSEDVLSRRHDKPEALEKRRKRWDLQVLRQQRQVERLRRAAAAQEGGGSSASDRGGGPDDKEHEGLLSAAGGGGGGGNSLQGVLRTFFPDPDRATHIHVGDSIPVSAFGYPLPLLEEEFCLPFTVPAAAAAATASSGQTSQKRKGLAGTPGGRKSLLKQHQ